MVMVIVVITPTHHQNFFNKQMLDTFLHVDHVFDGGGVGDRDRDDNDDGDHGGDDYGVCGDRDGDDGVDGDHGGGDRGASAICARLHQLIIETSLTSDWWRHSLR